MTKKEIKELMNITLNSARYIGDLMDWDNAHREGFRKFVGDIIDKCEECEVKGGD